MTFTQPQRDQKKWVPEIFREFPEFTDEFAGQNALRVKAAQADAELLSRIYASNKSPWQSFVRAVIEVGQLSPLRIRLATASSASSVSRWLAGKVQPHEKIRAKTALQLIDAVRHRADSIG